MASCGTNNNGLAFERFVALQLRPPALPAGRLTLYLSPVLTPRGSPLQLPRFFDDGDAKNTKTTTIDTPWPWHQLEFSTLTVTPPASGEAEETLTVIAEYFDASDIPVVVTSAVEGTDWAGGGRGGALFLSLLVLAVGTCCCGACCCLALGLLW